MATQKRDFSSWSDEFLEYGRNEKHWSEETLRAYESDLSQFCAFLKKNFPEEVETKQKLASNQFFSHLCQIGNELKRSLT